MDENIRIYHELNGRLQDCLKTKNPVIKASRLSRLMEDIKEVYDLPHSNNSIGLGLYNKAKEGLLKEVS